MSNTVTEVLTPVGGTLQVVVPGNVRHREWASLFWLTGSQFDRRLHTGSPGSCAKALSDSGPPSGQQRFSHRGGEVSVTGTADRTVGVCWTGPHHELYYYLRSTRPDVDEAASFLGALDITDSVDGIVVRPRRGYGLATRRLQMFTWFEGMFAMSVFHGAQHAQLLPAWQGHPVTGGELWRQAGSHGQPMLLLATSSAVVTLNPDPGQPALDRTLAAAGALIAEYRGVQMGAL